MLRKWLKRERTIRPVKNRTFVSDAMRDGARMTRLNWAIKINHNIASWNAFLVSFLSSIKNKKDWKFGYIWFCGSPVLLIPCCGTNYLDQKKLGYYFLAGKIICGYCTFASRKLNRKQFQISSFTSKSLFDLLQCILDLELWTVSGFEWSE